MINIYLSMLGKSLIEAWKTKSFSDLERL